LNGRNYFLNENDPPISPIITLPPLPDNNGTLIDKYGKLILIGLIGMFFLAIYPEQGGAEVRNANAG
jgi:hypothetical protein